MFETFTLMAVGPSAITMLIVPVLIWFVVDWDAVKSAQALNEMMPSAMSAAPAVMVNLPGRRSRLASMLPPRNDASSSHICWTLHWVQAKVSARKTPDQRAAQPIYGCRGSRLEGSQCARTPASGGRHIRDHASKRARGP